MYIDSNRAHEQWEVEVDSGYSWQLGLGRCILDFYIAFYASLLGPVFSWAGPVEHRFTDTVP